MALAVGGVAAALLAVYLGGGHLSLSLPWDRQANTGFKMQQVTTSYSFAPYVGGLDSPVFVTAAPGDPATLYVVEQSGTIRIVRDGKIAGTFLDIRSLVVSGGEQGLLSMAFSPHYASNHLFYVSYTNVHGDSRVVRYRSANGVGVRSSARGLLGVNQPYSNHNGGQLMFDKRGYLYFGLGDGGSEGDPNQTPQNLHTKLGKLLRSQSKTPGTRWRTVGLGLRNPWRFSFDAANDNLWLGDVGQNRYEEIDFRRAAKLDKLANYGWSRYEGKFGLHVGSPLLEGRGQGAAGGRLLARSRLLGHGRVRLPRLRGAGGARPLLLRRLLRRHDLELPGGAARARVGSGGLGPRSVALLLRRGRTRRALRDVARRHGLQAPLSG